MTGEVTIDAVVNGESGALEKLSELIAARQRYLKHETTENAVTATAINVVTSLRALTHKAPLKGNDDMHVTVCQVEGGAGWRGGGRAGPRRRTPVKDGSRMQGIYPVNLMYGLKGSGSLYRIELVNKQLEPKKSLNAPVYLVMAPNLTVAREYARARLTHALSKESGMAKYALGIAQAKVSDRPMNSDAPSGSTQMQRAYNAAVINKEYGDGTFGISVSDQLNYSMPALNGGDSAFETALMKAANRTAGIINHLAIDDLETPIPTPFPEIAS